MTQQHEALVEAVARVLYSCEKMRSRHADELIAKAYGKPVRYMMEPWEECRETFLGDALAVIPVVRKATLEEAAGVCEAQMKDFASPEYASGQPDGSFGERFACHICAGEIRALAAKDAQG